MKKVKLTESQLKKLLEWQLTEDMNVSDDTIEELYTKIVQSGGFSFDVKNNQYVTEAYFVSANPQLEQTIIFDEFQKDAESAKAWIKEFIYTNTEILSSHDNVFGAWKASDIRSGVETVFLDVTTVLTDKDAAVKLGCASKQQAIYDGFVGRDIPLTKEVYDENGYEYPFNSEEAPDQDTEIDSQLNNTEINNNQMNINENTINEVEQTKGGLAVRRLIIENDKVRGEFKSTYGKWDKSEWNLDGTPISSINKYDEIVNSLLIK